MCGRFTLTRVSYETLASELGVEADAAYAAIYRPRWNIAPTDPHWIVHLPEGGAPRRVLAPARWGLVNHWAKDAKRAAQQINARAESAATKPAYRRAFAARRCAVPADGWFEWVGTARRKQPIWFHRPDDAIVLLAGLHETWTEPTEGRPVRTFTLLTTAARGRPANYHDRMPVVLSADGVGRWLSPVPPDGEPETFIASVEERDTESLLASEVSRRVNSVRNDDPGCLAPAEPDSDPPLPGGTGRLF